MSVVFSLSVFGRNEFFFARIDKCKQLAQGRPRHEHGTPKQVTSRMFLMDKYLGIHLRFDWTARKIRPIRARTVGRLAQSEPCTIAMAQFRVCLKTGVPKKQMSKWIPPKEKNRPAPFSLVSLRTGPAGSSVRAPLRCGYGLGPGHGPRVALPTWPAHTDHPPRALGETGDGPTISALPFFLVSFPLLVGLSITF